MKVKDRDDEYLRKNFSELIKKHGGKWIVIVNGEKFAVVSKVRLADAMREVRKKYPRTPPLVSPIPTTHELQCILRF